MQLWGFAVYFVVNRAFLPIFLKKTVDAKGSTTHNTRHSKTENEVG